MELIAMRDMGGQATEWALDIIMGTLLDVSGEATEE